MIDGVKIKKLNHEDKKLIIKFNCSINKLGWCIALWKYKGYINAFGIKLIIKILKNEYV